MPHLLYCHSCPAVYNFIIDAVSNITEWHATDKSHNATVHFCFFPIERSHTLVLLSSSSTWVHIYNRQVRYDITLCPFHQLIGCCGQTAVLHLGCWSSWGWCPPPLLSFFWSLLLWAAWSWPLVPGQGLCLSHARLDLRHFMALTLPPTVTAALNEATCPRPGRRGDRRTLRLDTSQTRPVQHTALLISDKSVSSVDNGLPSVTTVRITKHNGPLQLYSQSRASNRKLW